MSGAFKSSGKPGHCGAGGTRCTPQLPECCCSRRLQVIAGFLGTAWLAIFLMMAYYLFVFDPGLDPFRTGPSDSDSPRIPRPNPIDAAFHRLRVLLYQRLFKPLRDPDTAQREMMAKKLNNIFNQVLRAVPFLSAFWSIRITKEANGNRES